jgi:hypothetical protein
MEKILKAERWCGNNPWSHNTCSIIIRISWDTAKYVGTKTIIYMFLEEEDGHFAF